VARSLAGGIDVETELELVGLREEVIEPGLGARFVK
jgi:hypothetical protein